MEWPNDSEKIRVFPEIDRAAWFKMEEAKKRILKGQILLLEELEKILRGPAHENG
jgi:predicted NUDIX family NTP pyrophosphohydrolase